MRIHHGRLLCLTLLMLVLTSTAHGENPPTRVDFASKVLGETRPLHIVLPAGYPKEQTYPTVYLLDGDHRYSGFVAERMHKANPQLIIVGIENVDRTRDMFLEPVAQKDNRGGGAENFLKFLTEELVPFVEANYHTSGFRVLSGQSNSGFFTLYAMLEFPKGFDAYLAASPMIGWDWEMIRDRSIQLLEGRKSFDRILFMNRGGTDYDHTVQFLPLYRKLLEDIAPQGFRWTAVVDEKAGHVPDSSFYQGIQFIFNP